jgi:hypothetical protein
VEAVLIPVFWRQYFGGIYVPLTLSLYISDEKNGVRSTETFLFRKASAHVSMVKKSSSGD